MVGDERMAKKKKNIIQQLKESSQYSAIKQSLEQQLSSNNEAISSYIQDMVEHYMMLWVTSRALEDDIEKRGVVVKWNNGGGQMGLKKNESIAELNKILLQMSRLLESLGINSANELSDPNGYEL